MTMKNEVFYHDELTQADIVKMLIALSESTIELQKSRENHAGLILKENTNLAQAIEIMELISAQQKRQASHIERLWWCITGLGFSVLCLIGKLL